MIEAQGRVDACFEPSALEDPPCVEPWVVMGTRGHEASRLLSEKGVALESFTVVSIYRHSSDLLPRSIILGHRKEDGN
jgi:hypothetical protein